MKSRKKKLTTNRAPFECSEELKSALINAQQELKYATTTMNEIESGETKRYWEQQLTSISLNLRHAQLEALNQQTSEAIDLYRQLRIAESRLYQLRLDLDRMHTTCFSSSKHKLILQAITQQELVVKHLDARLNHPRKSPMQTQLQMELEIAQANIKHYTDNHEQLLSAASEKLQTARQALTDVEAAISLERMRYNTAVNTKRTPQPTSSLQTVGAVRSSGDETPRVSSVGLFTPKLTTAEKRKFLVRTRGQTSNQVALTK